MKIQQVINKKNILAGIVFLLGLSLCIYTVLSAHWIQSVDGDNAPLTYAIYSTVAKCLHNGELPLWNSYIWGGVSDIGGAATQASYPVNWLLCWLFYDNSTEVLSYAIIPANLAVHISIYFVGLYLLLRKLKTKSIDAVVICVLSVMAFSFAKFYTWIVYFDGFTWFPLIVLATLYMFENKKTGTVCLCLLFVLEALLSVSQMLVIIVAFLAVLLTLHMINNKEWWHLLLKMGMTGIVAIFICFPVIVQQLVYISESNRYVPEVGWIETAQTVPISSFYSLRCTFDDLRAVFNVIPTINWISIGGIFLLLLIVGLFAKAENQIVFRWSIVGLVYTFFYALGIVFPEIVYYIPLLNVLREPFMYACLFNFFASLVAANGIRSIRMCANESKTINHYVNNNRILSIILVIYILYNLMPHNVLTWKSFCYVLMLLVLIVALNYCVLKKYNGVLIYLMLLGSVAANVCYFYNKMDLSGILNEQEAIKQIEVVNTHNKQEMEKLNNYGEYACITSWGAQCLPLNQQSLFSLRDVQGYYNPVSKKAVFLQNGVELDKRSQLQDIDYFLINDSNDSQFLDWFNARYDAFEKTDYKLNLYREYGIKDKDSVSVYQVNNNLGAGWCIGTWDSQEDMTEEQIREWINNPENDLSKVALLDLKLLSEEAIKKLADIDNEYIKTKVKLLERNNNSLKFVVNSDSDVIFACASLYASGWRVYVNGKRSELLQVDYTNIGTLLPEGQSEVQFVYYPDSLMWGYGFQAVAIVLITIYIVLKPNNWRRKNGKSA